MRRTRQGQPGSVHHPAAPDTAAPTHAHGPFQQLVGYEILPGGDGPVFRLPLCRDHLNRTAWCMAGC